MKEKIAYCGLDCVKCQAYIATQNNDDDLRKEVAKKWSELNNIEILPEMINCDGCKENGKKTVFCDKLCEIRKCAIGNTYNHCGECRNISSCNKIKMIIDNNESALSNLKRKN